MTSSSLASADSLAGSCADSQSVDTGYVSYSTRSLYVHLYLYLVVVSQMFINVT